MCKSTQSQSVYTHLKETLISTLNSWSCSKLVWIEYDGVDFRWFVTSQRKASTYVGQQGQQTSPFMRSVAKLYAWRSIVRNVGLSCVWISLLRQATTEDCGKWSCERIIKWICHVLFSSFISRNLKFVLNTDNSSMGFHGWIWHEIIRWHKYNVP